MKTLPKFTFPEGVGRESTYDWNVILDGKIHQLEGPGEGKDFECKEATFSSLCRTQADKADKKVKIAKVEGGVVVQATKMTEAEITARDTKRAERAAAKEAEEAAEAEATKTEEKAA